MDKVYKPIKVYLIRKKNWFIFDKNDIDGFLFFRCNYLHRESGNVEL